MTGCQLAPLRTAGQAVCGGATVAERIVGLQSVRWAAARLGVRFRDYYSVCPTDRLWLERLMASPSHIGNAGGGKGPWFRTNARSKRGTANESYDPSEAFTTGSYRGATSRTSATSHCLRPGSSGSGFIPQLDGLAVRCPSIGLGPSFFARR
jgi:hypothetical protein